MADYVSYHRGVVIYIGDNGCYLVEDGNKEFYFPTEQEAIEYIDEQIELQRDSQR